MTTKHTTPDGPRHEALATRRSVGRPLNLLRICNDLVCGYEVAQIPVRVVVVPGALSRVLPEKRGIRTIRTVPQLGMVSSYLNSQNLIFLNCTDLQQ